MVSGIKSCPSLPKTPYFLDTIMRIELEVCHHSKNFELNINNEFKTRLGHIRPSELLLPRKGLSEPTSKMLSQIAGYVNSSN